MTSKKELWTPGKRPRHMNLDSELSEHKKKRFRTSTLDPDEDEEHTIQFDHLNDDTSTLIDDGLGGAPSTLIDSNFHLKPRRKFVVRGAGVLPSPSGSYLSYGDGNMNIVSPVNSTLVEPPIVGDLDIDRSMNNESLENNNSNFLNNNAIVINNNNNNFGDGGGGVNNRVFHRIFDVVSDGGSGVRKEDVESVYGYSGKNVGEKEEIVIIDINNQKMKLIPLETTFEYVEINKALSQLHQEKLNRRKT